MIKFYSYLNKAFFISALLILSRWEAFSQNRFEVSMFSGYSRPMLEAYGSNNLLITSDASAITIGGKSILNSDNFSTTFGYMLQVTGKYNFVKSGILKAIVNLGYNQLQSKYGGLPDGWPYGVRLYMYYIGAGIETVPFKVKKIYPSFYGLLNITELGGETYHFAGIDFLIVSPRIGYTIGTNINYRLNKIIGLFLGLSYNYTNWLGKQTNEGKPTDPYGHDNFFRDKASPTNGLSHDRRIAYTSYLAGVNFYIK